MDEGNDKEPSSAQWQAGLGALALTSGFVVVVNNFSAVILAVFGVIGLVAMGALIVPWVLVREGVVPASTMKRVNPTLTTAVAIALIISGVLYVRFWKSPGTDAADDAAATVGGPAVRTEVSGLTGPTTTAGPVTTVGPTTTVAPTTTVGPGTPINAPVLTVSAEDGRPGSPAPVLLHVQCDPWSPTQVLWAFVRGEKYFAVARFPSCGEAGTADSTNQNVWIGDAGSVGTTFVIDLRFVALVAEGPLLDSKGATPLTPEVERTLGPVVATQTYRRDR